MIVSGTVTLRMAQVIQRVWQQVSDPKWCISMGACSSVGGPFNAYSVLQGVDRIVPVDVYLVGCPPRPEALFYALLKLQDKIDNMTLAKTANGSTPATAGGGRIQEECHGGADSGAQ
jgi:NADH-quinone oxidoreductase subunit B